MSTNDYVSKVQVEKAREWSVMDYLQQYESSDIKRKGKSYKCAFNDGSGGYHDSLWVFNDGWSFSWKSTGKGGFGAIDFLMKCKDMNFQDAVRLLAGEDYTKVTTVHKVTREQAIKAERKEFILPEKNDNHKRVYAYLSSRGLSKNIIQYCLKEHLVYESKMYHNAIFVGYDEQGKARYANKRGTLTGSEFKGEVTGADKHYSFKIMHSDSSTIHLFESAIDSLSWLSFQEIKGVNWQKQSILSLGGVSKSDGNNSKITVPLALQNTLKASAPGATKFVLHFDNDEVGRGAAEDLSKLLSERGYTVSNAPSPKGKDWNDYLVSVREKQTVRYLSEITGTGLNNSQKALEHAKDNSFEGFSNAAVATAYLKTLEGGNHDVSSPDFENTMKNLLPQAKKFLQSAKEKHSRENR